MFMCVNRNPGCRRAKQRPYLRMVAHGFRLALAAGDELDHAARGCARAARGAAQDVSDARLNVVALAQVWVIGRELARLAGVIEIWDRPKREV